MFTQTKPVSFNKKLDAILDGYGSAIRGIEKCIQRHEIAFSTLKAQIENCYNEKLLNIEKEETQFSKKLGGLSVDNNNIKSLIEFFYQEILFKLRNQLQNQHVIGINKNDTANKLSKEMRIVNPEEMNNSGYKKLNLGCGYIQKENFINVDLRELPGVDLIADITMLPFEESSIDEIYAAHVIEKFSKKDLKNIVLPYWLKLLKTGGQLILIASNADVMIKGYSEGNFLFSELREVLFGRQEEGDFHVTMLNHKGVMQLVEGIGFTSVRLIASKRHNGCYYEFEVAANK